MIAALSAAPLAAAVESVQVEPTFVPRLSPAMEMEGVTQARLVVAIAVDETGKLTETLVLGTTHPAFVRLALDAIKEWRYTPAKLDGRPIAAQTEMTIDYSAQGVVVSRGSMVDLEQFMAQRFGPRMEKRAVTAAELDRRPAQLSTVAPHYALEAQAQGVRGAVEVFFYIDENGAVRMPSIGAGGDPYLAQSAVEAVKAWRFEPPTRHGRPVVVAARQTFKFGS